MSSKTYHRTADLLEAQVHDDLVALDPRQGTCFGFNSVAAEVWRLLATPKRFDEIRDVLMRDYDVGEEACTSDLNDLLARMIEVGLIST